jgi:hypothetical protein
MPNNSMNLRRVSKISCPIPGIREPGGRRASRCGEGEVKEILDLAGSVIADKGFRVSVLKRGAAGSDAAPGLDLW